MINTKEIILVSSEWLVNLAQQITAIKTKIKPLKLVYEVFI